MTKETWHHLKQSAKLGFDRAYAPYSKFHVGAAALDNQGNVFFGCNVENASYGLTVCAERNCIAQAVINGSQTLNQLVVYTEQEKLTPPCGACRQVIAEFMAPECEVKAMNHLGNEKTWTVAQLLPDAFTPKDLL
ncbi:cytidine deaminase [Thalassotalea euphylliae]|uniref:Cytidine deaminase n=1 Tax=Thalassotalea euphylliae TaxID=1655234 RepID=A0A3E0TYH3_9GAMM|nr:cytidine deaminase [Thalassotalea euphylliae]REL29500.1 cytidine deaminase [Thalassotalea euphylliae]